MHTTVLTSTSYVVLESSQVLARFEANCHMLRELDREKRKLRQQLEGRRRHHSAGAGLLRSDWLLIG